MKIIAFKSLAKWLPMLLLPLLFAACSDKDEPETPGEDVVEPKPPTSAQEAYYTLAGNYFDANEPSVGTALDEAKPNELSKVAETVELALEDFERYLPKSKDTKQFIHRSGNTVSVELDTLGTVKFEPANGDGIVARVEVNLKEMQRYTVLYRTKASYSENNDGSIFSRTYYPGDVVEFKCFSATKDINMGLASAVPEYLGNHCYKRKVNGVVIEASDNELYVFTTHRHQFQLGRFTFDYDVVSLEGWQKIYNAMKKYHDDFRESFQINSSTCPSVNDLYCLFEQDEFFKKYICIDGNDLNWSAFAFPTWWDIFSDAGRLSVNDLREGNFSNYEMVRYAKFNKVIDIDCAYYSLIKIDSIANAVTLRLIWSSHN